MGLFEAVQGELFDFLGYEKPSKQAPPQEKFLAELPYPVNLERKSHLRGLRFSVSQRGVLEIRANNGASEAEILELLAPYQKWILDKMDEAQNFLKKHPQKKWRSGEVFPWSGQSYRLFFSPSLTKKPHIRFMEKSFEYFFPESWLQLSRAESEQLLHESFLKFFKVRASESLNERLRYWTEHMNLHPRSVTYRNQKSRWGSCSSQGRINLNWRLIAFRPEIQDYVLVHELAHLVHQNHSKNFWALVALYIPNYKALGKELHASAPLADCYAKKSELYEQNPSLKWAQKNGDKID